jgi:hypothetical protein
LMIRYKYRVDEISSYQMAGKIKWCFLIHTYIHTYTFKNLF